MCRYILDTDCVSLILYNHPQLTAKAVKHPFAVTIITVQELFNGWVVRPPTITKEIAIALPSRLG